MNDAPDTMSRMWTIYFNAMDYPGRYVVREWLVSAKGPESNGVLRVTDDLDHARAIVPPGAHNLGRYPNDDAVIVETWI